jgi:hypothetical protein
MALKQLFANNAATYLSQLLGGTISNTVLYIVSGDESLFPVPVAGSEYFLLTIEDPETKEFEIVRVTSVSGNQYTVTRAQEDTSAKAFPVGAKVQLRATKETYENLYNRAEQLSSYIHKQKTAPAGPPYVWVVTHSLNRYPAVTIQEGTWTGVGTDTFTKTSDVEADVSYTTSGGAQSKTQLRITFSSPIIGRVVCT